MSGHKSENNLMNDFQGSVYFLGIGGIGMSALARFFVSKGIAVSGYDKTPTALTAQLQQEGMRIHFEDDLNLIDRDAALVIYTPAIPKDHNGWNFYKENNYRLVKRSDVLQMITQSSLNVCVAGTHGKTTISCMLGHILRHSGFGCNAFLGGISTNYNTNFWSSSNNCCVVEADEYDRSFHKLNPDFAVITAMDPDHLDIYGTATAMEDAFVEFTHKIKPGGFLVSKFGLSRTSDLVADTHLTYHLNNEAADVKANNLQIENGAYRFDVVAKTWRMDNVLLNMGGLHNVENAIAAITICKALKLGDEAINAALASFSGVKRRFEYWKKTEEQVMIDDYAHHPEELRALITSAKNLFPDKKCTVIFQPHLFTRTRDLAVEFAEVLDLADQVILLPIYPARELPIEGVTSDTVLSKMKLADKQILEKAEMLEWLQNNKLRLLVIAGAGDIDAQLEKIKDCL
jgi:UDP-N-acetylmuramate--alanine ligase